MRKSKPIEVVIHMPDDIEAFEKIYIEALFEAIKQVAETVSQKV